jgi:hypothetical protein
VAFDIIMDHGTIDEEDDDFVNGNYTTRKFSPMEVETEQDSLVRETADLSSFGRTPLHFRRRMAAARNNALANTDQEGDGLFLGFVRHGVGSSFSLRNFILLSVLSATVLLLINVLDSRLEQAVMEDVLLKGPPHQGTFGGSRNPGQFQQDGNGDVNDDELPKSNINHAVHSLTAENINNHNGEYWHDSVLSPFASPLYANMDNSSRANEQKHFQAQMEALTAQYGQWEPPNFEGLVVPKYHHYDYRDIPNADLLANAWQKNEKYVQSFLQQAQALVERVKLGIFAEYGYSDDNIAESKLESYHKRRDATFGVIVDHFRVINEVAVDEKTEERLSGIAYLNKNAWQGLIRKLLHAIITQDDFYVVGVGPASTYRGNNFFQSQVMQFHRIMEPVFRKLGVRLISRNMGMDASTTVSALGGADVYGEADIFWYISDTTARPHRESRGQMDLLHKQAILAGERMPIILTPEPVVLMTDTDGKAWVGNIQPGVNICGETRISDGNIRLPQNPTCRYVNCVGEALEKNVCDHYESVCWINRKGFGPDYVQEPNVGFQQDYMGVQTHQLEGRKLAMLVLRGLESALERWESETDRGLFPLDDKQWHVQDVYESLRESVRTLERKPGKNAKVPACEEFLYAINPMMCHMALHAFSEWTPRINPEYTSIRSRITSSVGDNHELLQELYGGVDVLPLQWKTAEEQVDVHMIAIAANATSFSSESDKDIIIGGDQQEYDDDAWIAMINYSHTMLQFDTTL